MIKKFIKRLKQELDWFWRKDGIGFEPDRRPIDRIAELFTDIIIGIMIIAAVYFFSPLMFS